MVEEIFSKHLLVQIKNGDRDDRKVKLKVTLEFITLTTPLQRKQMRIQITDDKDLFFLYTMKIDEEDFQHLKSQQGLLVDFPSFPQKLVELFERSREEELKESPKYVLQFMKEGTVNATFSVVETNPFKHLTHLALRLVQGADTDVKQYLADCLKALKERSTFLESQLLHVETTLTADVTRLGQELERKTADFDQLQNEWNSRSNEVQSQHTREITEEKQKALKAQATYQQKYEVERKDLEHAHMKIVKQLEARIYELDLSNKDLTEKKYKWEAAVRDLTARSASLEEEAARFKSEAGALRKENAAVDGACHKQERKTQHLSTRVAVLEQQVGDKEALLSKSSELLSAEQDSRKRAEEEAAERSRHGNQLEASVKRMSEEIVKANEIIRKLQTENKHYHNKVKLRSEITLQQEKVLNEKDEALRKVKADLELTVTAQNDLKSQFKDLELKYADIQKQFGEAKELNRTNENVISWLNKQINEKQLSSTRSGSSSLLPHRAAPNRALTASATGATTTASYVQNPKQRLDGESLSPNMCQAQPISESTPLMPEGSIRHSTKQPAPPASKQATDLDKPLAAKYFEKNESGPLRSIANVLHEHDPAHSGRINLALGFPKPQPLDKSLASSYFPKSTKGPVS